MQAHAHATSEGGGGGCQYQQGTVHGVYGFGCRRGLAGTPLCTCPPWVSRGWRLELARMQRLGERRSSGEVVWCRGVAVEGLW